MVGVFASLKWRLFTGRLRATSGAGRIGAILALVVVYGFVALMAVGLASLRGVPDYRVPAVTSLFAVQLVAWVVAPLVAFGVDETVDPARFALLPIRPQVLQRGLLVTALIGWFPLANVIILAGAAVATGVPLAVLPVSIGCALAQLGLCIVLSRAASTSMSALMSSRRGRDLGMVVGLLVFLLYLGFVAVINSPGDRGAVGGGVLTVASAMQWTPPGALASLPGLISSGLWARAVIAAAIAFAAMALAWWWWSTALVRSLTTAPSTTAASAPARRSAATAVGGGVVGTMRVVAGRDRLLAWRDPMRRMPWLMLVVLTTLWPLIVVRSGGAVFAVAFGAALCGSQAGNQYGVEGSGLWLHLQTITDQARARGEVLGHVIAAIVPATVIVVASTTILAVVHGNYRQVPAALGVSLAMMMGAAATVSYFSAAMPYAQPQSRKSMFASSVPGQKGRTGLVSLGMFGGAILVALPAAVLVGLSVTKSPSWGWAALIVGPACGIAAILVSVRMTAARFLEKATEIFQVVSAGDRV